MAPRVKLGLANAAAILGVLPLSFWAFAVSDTALMFLLRERTAGFALGFSDLVLMFALMGLCYGIAAAVALPSQLYAARVRRANADLSSNRSARVVRVLVIGAAVAPMAALALVAVVLWRQVALAS